MNQIYIKFHGDLKELFDTRFPEGSITLNYESTLETLREKIGISVDDVVIMLVNGAAVNRNTRLKEGDKIDVFTPLTGG